MKLNVFVIEKHMARNQETYSSLAEKAGTTRQTLYSVLKKETCTPVIAGRIASALNVNVDDIVEEG